LQLGGTPTNGLSSVTGLSAGSHTEVLAAESISELNAARIISDSDITVSNINVREAIIDNLVVDIVATLVLPTSNSYLPEIKQVVNGTNLWEDPAPVIGSNWTDNGGGNYFHSNVTSLTEIRSGIDSLEPNTLYSVELTVTKNAVASTAKVIFVAGGEEVITLPPATPRKNVIYNFDSNMALNETRTFVFNIRTESSYEVNAFRIFAQRARTVENIKIKKAEVINPLCDIIETTG
jgi:hypothetical protein